MQGKILSLFFVTLSLSLLAPLIAHSQEEAGNPVVVDPTAGITPELSQESEPGDATTPNSGHSVTPLLAPIPFKNTQLGWGLMLMGGLIHYLDPDTSLKPSTAMAGGFYTQNGSWGMMALENARLAGDSWRLRFMMAHPEVRYDFYGIGQEAGNAGKSVEIQQNMNLILFAALGRIAPNLYVGGTALYMGASVSLRDTSGLGLPPPAGEVSSVHLFALGAQAEADTRDDDYWPAHGSLTRLKSTFFLNALGGERSFQRYQFAWSLYSTLREQRLVLATNINVNAASSGTPFWALPAIGFGRGGLRGYTQGRYRDAVMATEQAELRYHTEGRFGATLFFGLGHVAPTVGNIFTAEVMPAGGFGLRYQLTEKFPMHLRFDMSWGRDGFIFHFGASEAF